MKIYKANAFVWKWVLNYQTFWHTKCKIINRNFYRGKFYSDKIQNPKRRNIKGVQGLLIKPSASNDVNLEGSHIAWGSLFCIIYAFQFAIFLSFFIILTLVTFNWWKVFSCFESLEPFDSYLTHLIQLWSIWHIFSKFNSFFYSNSAIALYTFKLLVYFQNL